MRQRTAIGKAIAIVLLGAGMAAGQTRFDGLVSKLNGAQFDVVMGRITVLNTRCRQGHTQSTNDQSAGVRESLSLSVDDGAPSLQYELIDKSQRLVVEFSDGQLMISREPRGDSPFCPVYFEQPAAGRITLKTGEDAGERLHGETIWHLLLAETPSCRAHLVPVLEVLHPNWRLMEKADRLRMLLHEIASSDWEPRRELLAHLLDELGDPRFASRQAAERRLRSMGLAVLPFLDRVDPQQLDAEQRLRIHSIQRRLKTPVVDTPERVAAWLTGDPAVWLSLLSDEDPIRRQRAAQHLVKITGSSLMFDPRAEEDMRTEQLAALRERLTGQ